MGINMKTFFILLFTVFTLFYTGENLFAQRGTAQTQTLEVRLASPLPRESPWGRTLDRLAAEWSRVTNGQVRLRVLHGGVEGGEDRMRLSLSTNAIQGALFTSFGLSNLEPSILTLSAPFLIRTDSELIAVLNELGPELEERINSGSYFLLSWSRAGFVNFFSREPLNTPQDLRNIRLASSSEAGQMNDIFRALGYQIVEGDWLTVGLMLNSGTVSGLYQNPAAMAALQMHNLVRYMLPINIAPVLGGIVLNQVTWNRIGALNPRYQTELLRVTRDLAEEFDSAMPRTMNEAVQSMRRTGLIVNELTPQQEQLWIDEFERTLPSLLGTAFDTNLYNRILTILERERSGR